MAERWKSAGKALERWALRDLRGRFGTVFVSVAAPGDVERLEATFDGVTRDE